MQYRQLPPAGTLSDIEAIWQAVPQTPDKTDDCCQRLVDRTAIANRTHASQWLVFLTALGCVQEDDGYFRGEQLPSETALADTFEQHLFGVGTILEQLNCADGPRTREEVLNYLPERTYQRIERVEHPEEYLTRLLEWAVTFGHIEQTEHGYSVS